MRDNDNPHSPMRMLMQLERLQADFAAALLDVGTEQAILSAFTCAEAQAAERLALYRSHVLAGCERMLANAYPIVLALVGEEFFALLARAYRRTHASVSGDLNAFGKSFPEFISGFEPLQSLPYLGDVAVLDRLVHCAQYAADANALERERLATMSPRELLASRFELHPACGWTQSRYPIASIWRAHQFGSVARWPDTLARGGWTLVTRPTWCVEIVESSAAEIAALAILRAGGSMGDAINAALAGDAECDFGMTLLRWLDLAVLVRKTHSL